MSAPHLASSQMVFADGHNAAVGCFAHDVLKLDGGVMDFKIVAQTVVDGTQNRVTL